MTIYYLGVGLILGLTAGLSPGPLLTLVISETLQNGVKAGIKVAIAPLITDAPIVILMLLFASQLSNYDEVVGVLSLIGSCYICYIAYGTAQTNNATKHPSERNNTSLSKGVITNLLSPHPYLFWLTIGVPTVIKSISVSAAAPPLFIIGFYLPLVGSKVMLAWLTGKYKSILSAGGYKYIMRFLALLLGVFAMLLFIDGVQLLGFYHDF